MASGSARERAERDVLGVLPDRAGDLARLRVLAGARLPVVTVVGKYNHGKSRLLNELVGDDAFAVADRRETVALAGHEHRGVQWLDAPGLDADVGTGDDRLALRAAWRESDVRLFVHAAREGELDAAERALLAELRDDAARTRRQTLFVLSQVDQTADEAQLAKVADAVRAQLPGLELLAVSATRHRLGVEGAKALLRERSGIPALQARLDAALALVPQARRHEAALLLGEIRAALQRCRSMQATRRAELQRTQAEQRQAFDRGLAAVFAKVAGDLQRTLDVPGPDHALTPDTSADKYRTTAAKRERARVQIAYSRASIEIESFLAGHGVVGLPQAQQTVARGLNTVMVAVLGVSVKFRADLRRMFLEAEGSARLRAEFAHYYELSDDRQALARDIAAADLAVTAAERALAALAVLEEDAR